MRVFISHAWEDKPLALALAQLPDFIDAWVDVRELLGGESRRLLLQLQLHELVAARLDLALERHPLFVGRLQLLRQFVKLLGHLFSIFSWLIVFVPAAFTARRQGLHELDAEIVRFNREEAKEEPERSQGE